MKTNRFLLVFLLFFFVSNSLLSQEYRLACIPKGERKWGYIDLKGEMIVPPQSWMGLPYTDDGTVLSSKTNMPSSPKILFDRDGNEIVPDIKIKLIVDGWTEVIYGITGGMFIQKRKGKLGALNTKGKLTVQFLYTELTDFSEGYALGRREKVYYVVDSEGNETLIGRNDEITHIKKFSEGLAPIELNGKHFGFVNTIGKIVIEPEYKTVGYFSGGYSWVRIQNGIIGYINKKGEWIIEPKFEVAKDFDKESGMALVQMNSSDNFWSYTDTTGNVINFEVARENFGFSEGLAITRSGLLGYLNNKGEWVIEPIFNGAAPFNNGYAAVQKGKWWGLINKKGEWVLQPEYKAIGEVVKIE